MKLKNHVICALVLFFTLPLSAMDQESVALMEHISFGEDVNFSSEDFKDIFALEDAIKRELQHNQAIDNQQDDSHKMIAAIAQKLKTALDLHSKQLSAITLRDNTTVLSCVLGDIDVVKVLLNFPDDAEVQTLLTKANRVGYIPLHFAAIQGRIEVAYLMLLKSNNPISLLTRQNRDNLNPRDKAVFNWICTCNYKTQAYLDSAKQAYEQGGDQGLRTFLENYTVEIPREGCGCCCCCCCTIL